MSRILEHIIYLATEYSEVIWLSELPQRLASDDVYLAVLQQLKEELEAHTEWANDIGLQQFEELKWQLDFELDSSAIRRQWSNAAREELMLRAINHRLSDEAVLLNVGMNHAQKMAFSGYGPKGYPLLGEVLSSNLKTWHIAFWAWQGTTRDRFYEASYAFSLEGELKENDLLSVMRKYTKNEIVSVCFDENNADWQKWVVLEGHRVQAQRQFDCIVLYPQADVPPLLEQLYPG